MPTEYSDNFGRSASVARLRANLASEIAMRLQCATGTPEEVVAAIAARVAFIEEYSKNPQAAENVRRTIPDPARVRNFNTLDRELGEDTGLSARLARIMDSIDADFPELDGEDRLYLKRDVLALFTPARQNDFHAGYDRAVQAVDSIFGTGFSDRSMASVFTRAGGQYHAVLSVDPGTINARSYKGDPSSHAQRLRDDIESLYRDASAAGGRYHDMMEERREAAREAARAARRAAPEA